MTTWETVYILPEQSHTTMVTSEEWKQAITNCSPTSGVIQLLFQFVKTRPCGLTRINNSHDAFIVLARLCLPSAWVREEKAKFWSRCRGEVRVLVVGGVFLVFTGASLNRRALPPPCVCTISPPQPPSADCHPNGVRERESERERALLEKQQPHLITPL